MLPCKAPCFKYYIISIIINVACGQWENQCLNLWVICVLSLLFIYLFKFWNFLGSCDYQPPRQHLPGSAEGQVAGNTPGIWARRRCGLLLHHQAAGQRQQLVRGPLCLATGVKGDQACCRKQGVLSKTQRCMLISPLTSLLPPLRPNRRTLPLLLPWLVLAAAFSMLLWLSSSVFPLCMISGFGCLAGGEINLIAASISFPTHSIWIGLWGYDYIRTNHSVVWI